MRKKETAVWFYPAIDEIDDVDAKQYHRASFSTRNSALNTSLRKPIRMQDFIQLCDSMFYILRFVAKTRALDRACLTIDSDLGNGSLS